MEAEVRPDEQLPPTQSPTKDAIFQSLSTYPFSTDADFQTGLASILGPSNELQDEPQDDKRRQETILQAQCFYFARKYNLPPLDPALYQSWLQTQPQPNPIAPTPQPQANPTTTPPPPEPPYPTSFAHIVDLITNNKPIPGIEEIPDTVLAAGSSQPNKTPRRRKPWETDDGTNTDEGGGDVVRLLQPIATSEMPDEAETETKGQAEGDKVTPTVQP